MEFEKFSMSDAKLKALEYFSGDEIAADAYLSKYALKGDNCCYEPTPDFMHKRLAKEFARVEAKYTNGLTESEIYNLIRNFTYIVPQGGSMFGIGNPLPISLSNCFVIGNRFDSYGSICKTDEEQIQLMKRRGGVGHDLSYLRYNGARVENSARSSSGMATFMERYSNSTREVAQDGRRGALMLSCHVKHPDANKFIDAKLEQGKITGANISIKLDDEFMEAVCDHKTYTQQFPINSENPTFTQELDALSFWNKLMHNAWKSAEPGILFWDTLKRESTARLYGPQFEETSTNPCLTAETMVAVADGRGSVSIGELAKLGADVPVYCYNSDGQIEVQLMRNPRITGFNQPIYKVTLDTGDVVRCTGNHKFLTTDGKYVAVSDMKIGESLSIVTQSKRAIMPSNDNNEKYRNYITYHNGNKKFFEHRLIAEHNYGKIERGNVVHHIDKNPSNNNPSNLQVLLKKEHDAIHGDEMKGLNNPIYQIKSNPERFAEYSAKMSESTGGIKNGMYREDITDEQLFNAGVELCKKNNRGFSRHEYSDYVKKSFGFTRSLYREQKLFNPSFESYVMNCIEKAGIKNENYFNDRRILTAYDKALSMGYECKIVENIVYVKRICEECGASYWVKFNRREYSFCSKSCSSKYATRKYKDNLIEARNKSAKNTGDKNKKDQLKVFTALKMELDRIPSRFEWEQKCKEIECPFRLGTKYSFANFGEVISTANYFNHRVVSIELDGTEDVYNGTVDKHHNFLCGAFDSQTTKNDKIYLKTLNCGEIGMNPYSSCILLAVNLYSYVKYPFTEKAEFDFELFEHHAKIAQRLADDIIELECEKIDQIIEKIKNDPEDEKIKKTEIELWLKIRNNHQNTRRTGVGPTAIGDMLAALNYKYGTKQATSFAAVVQRVFATACYTSSIEMAKERGSFPIWNFETEKYSPFINRIIDLIDSETYRTYLRYGRRNIHCLTIAPTGCCDPSMKIITNEGILSFEHIFKLNGIDLNSDEYKSKSNFWIEPIKEMYAPDINGKFHKISKLYINGKTDGLNITLSNGEKLGNSLVHKYLVKIDDNYAVWKTTEELCVGDKILKRTGIKIPKTIKYGEKFSK